MTTKLPAAINNPIVDALYHAVTPVPTVRPEAPLTLRPRTSTALLVDSALKVGSLSVLGDNKQRFYK